jgi:hypothetical protein
LLDHVARANDEAPTKYEYRGPATVGDVEVLCGPELLPTPTASPSATPEPSRPATPTASPSPTPPPTGTPIPSPTTTPTAVPTPVPMPAYLPLLLKEAPCAPGFQHTDVVLVIDASTSMRDERTAVGRSKLEAAGEAVRLFLDNLDFAGGDQAAIVQFNAGSDLLQRLTDNPADLSAALPRIEVTQQTRIHLGIAAARAELASERHRAANNRAMVVLTDGRNNPEPVAVAEAEAALAKAEGIRVFTIGLGAEVEREALARMASRREDFFYAPDGEDLLAIYDQIAYAIPCPPEVYWPYRR